MADAEKNPFIDDSLQEENPFIEMGKPKVVRAEPLTASERLKLVLLFDDKKRRQSYLKKIGFEMDPSDTNKVRPLGSDEKFATEIDPGGLSDLSQYYANPKGGKAGLSELALDTVEALDSFFQGAAEEAAGLAAGATAAGTAGVPTAGAAAIPAFMGGRAIGRATANLLLTNLKEEIGNLMLDETVPVGMEDKLFQAAISSVAPEVVMSAGKGVVNSGKQALRGLRSGFQYLMNMTGGNVSDEAMEALAKDPKTFGNIDNLKKAPEKIMEMISQSTGLGPEEGIPRKFRDLGDTGLFKTKMAEAEQLRRATVNQLAGDNAASTNAEFIIGMLQNAKDKLLSDKVVKSKNTQSAAAEFDNYINMVKQATGNNGVINFKQLDEMVKEIQDDAFGSEGAAAVALRGLAHDVNSYAKSVANRVAETSGLDISDYVASKAKEAKIYNAFDSFAKNVTPQKALTRIIGRGAKGATGKGTDFTDKALSETFANMDDALDTEISSSLQNGQLQNEILRAVEGGKFSQGSRGFWTGAAALGLPTAMATGGNPLATGAAMMAGGIGASPNQALPAISGLSRGINRLSGVDSFLNDMQLGSGGNQADMLRAAIQGASEKVPPASSFIDRLKPPPEEKNPFIE